MRRVTLALRMGGVVGNMGGSINIGILLGLYWGYVGDNGKENGNYYNGLRDYRVYGWFSKLWSLFGVPIIIRPLTFRVPKKGP